MKKKSLGMMIAELRKANGMTQLELADRMGVTDKAVSKWERDLSCPDLSSMPKLAEIFDMSVDELMQVKSDAAAAGERKSLDEIVALALKAVAMGMGVSVTVLSILGGLEPNSGMGMLGIGLACLAAALLSREGAGRGER